MMRYLAIDIGASSGRHIIGTYADGKLKLREIYRFKNSPQKSNGNLVWDTERLFGEIISGLKKCGELGEIPDYIGIDTWGVDYALLDKNDELIPPVFSYRDWRTNNVACTVEFDEMFALTGIAYNSFNTVYQLLCDKSKSRLDGAEDMLMLPEYFSFLLTGKKVREYTNATTTGLVSPLAREWEYGLISKLDLPRKLFPPLREPPCIIGDLSPSIVSEVGYNAKLVLVASHDTASAVVAAAKERGLFISSGTWSLLGIECDPVLSIRARDAGYSNEGTPNGKVRLLKNIMGLWVIQEVRRELDDAYSFEQLARMAEEAAGFDAFIDINKKEFFAPDSMIGAIKRECEAAGKSVPATVGELAKCVYLSLAHCYKAAITELEGILGRKFTEINIIGGGCKNAYLNKLTAEIAKIKVLAGPDEATTVGNILLQMKAGDKSMTTAKQKEIINNSFEITESNFEATEAS